MRGDLMAKSVSEATIDAHVAATNLTDGFSP
jgi:hypothetical protein